MNTNVKIPNSIGLMGFAGAGKDTVANILQGKMAEAGVYSKLERFAKPIKMMAEFVFGQDFDDRPVKEVVVPFTPTMVIRARKVILDYGYENLTEDEFKKLTHSPELKFLLAKAAVSPRQFQQWVGTEVFRTIRQSIWVDRLQNPDGTQLITDVRFDNELEILDSIVFVNRPGVEPVNSHKSELLATELLETYHHKYPVKMKDLKSSTHTFFRGKPVLFVHNAYSLSRLHEILDEI